MPLKNVIIKENKEIKPKIAFDSIESLKSKTYPTNTSNKNQYIIHFNRPRSVHRTPFTFYCTFLYRRGDGVWSSYGIDHMYMCV